MNRNGNDTLLPKNSRCSPLSLCNSKTKKINQTRTTTDILLSNTSSKKTSSLQSTNNMCPIRILLVLFSAILAGYMAWRSVRTSSETDNNVFNDDSSIHKQEWNIKGWPKKLEPDGYSRNPRHPGRVYPEGRRVWDMV
ncbi:hypothetical protein HanRHA438_Chr06g0257061 [Helianthus annuus]|nr:hypothetical protein HanRHA438_Chr06g0257061 [Helianthus annuus]